MTNREFENYLALVSRLLRLKRGQCEQIAVELRDHLELRVAELIQSGADPDEATRQALEEFGDAATLAGQFQFINQTYQKRWMMRFATLSVAGLFLAAVFTMAMWPSQARFGAPDAVIANGPGSLPAVSEDEETMSDNARRNIEIRKALTKETILDCEATEFADVMDSMTDQYGFNVVLDHSARDDSLQEDTPITFKIQGIPLNKALKLMLTDHNATYVVDSGVVRIISQDVASDPEYFSRKIFDVSNLLQQIAQLEKHRIGTPRKVSHFSRGGGGIFCSSALPLQTPAEPVVPPDPQIHNVASGDLSPEKTTVQVPDKNGGALGGGAPSFELMTPESMLSDLIKTTVAPDSWSDTNGDGTLEILGGLMVVTQTEAVNESIDELLQDLSYRYSVILKK